MVYLQNHPSGWDPHRLDSFVGSARAKRFGANSGSHCGSISGRPNGWNPVFGGDFLRDLGGFWWSFGWFLGNICGIPLFEGDVCCTTGIPFFGKKTGILNCVIQNLIAVEMSQRFIFHISRHKGPNFQRFLLSLEQWSILAGIPCWLRPLSKGSIKRNVRAPRSYTPENERMTMENQPLKRCIYPLLKMVMCHCHVSFPGGEFAKSQTSSW